MKKRKKEENEGRKEKRKEQPNNRNQRLCWLWPLSVHPHQLKVGAPPGAAVGVWRQITGFRKCHPTPGFLMHLRMGREHLKKSLLPFQPS